MNAKEFFKNGITDNNYQGHLLNTLELNRDFITDMYRKHNVQENRKKDIAAYLLGVRDLIAGKKLSELEIKQITFGDEFDANKDQKVFEISGNNFDDLKIYTGNIVGSIIYKKRHFNINCRFGNEFLQYMIANASGFLELENLGAIDKDYGLGEWILTYYWKLQLKKAFSLGLYKTYQKKKENLVAIRGEMDINSILKKGYFDGKTVCNFKEHSYNNELNFVIRLALKKVFKSQYQSIVSDIYNIKNAFDSINISNFNIQSVRNQSVINPYFRKYNQVFDLSLKILKDEFANVGDNNSDFSAFLFDISLLFEHHIRKILKQVFTLLPKNKKEFKIPNGIYENNVYPDIIIDFGNNEIGVYDVKYKNFDFIHGVNRDDKFQLITYVATHLAKYKVVECGIIYPLKEVNQHKISFVKEQILKIGADEIPFKVQFYKICDMIKNQQVLDKEFITKIKLLRQNINRSSSEQDESLFSVE